MRQALRKVTVALLMICLLLSAGSGLLAQQESPVGVPGSGSGHPMLSGPLFPPPPPPGGGGGCNSIGPVIS